jgi:hypothetical protein
LAEREKHAIMRKAERITSAVLGTLVLVSLSTAALRVGPSAFHLEQRAETEEKYILAVTNDTDRTEEVRLYLGDWLRTPTGEHDWDIPLDGFRFTLDQDFDAGDTVRVRYAISIPAGHDLQISGEFLALNPRLTGAIRGPSTLAVTGASGETTTPSDSRVSVTRTVESISPLGMAAVSLDVKVLAAVSGIQLYEKLSQHAEVTSLDTAGGTFDTVSRSCADWIALSDGQLSLSPNETRQVALRIATPVGISGMYWAVVFVESMPTPESSTGTQILSVYRTAVKVYVTAPGTAQVSGHIEQVDVTGTNPLSIAIAFDCTGNVQLAASGAVDVIDETGETVRSIPIAEFYVLPASYRSVQVVDSSLSPLPPGIYQAVVHLDYGGDSLAAGVRAFRVR